MGETRAWLVRQYPESVSEFWINMTCTEQRFGIVYCVYVTTCELFRITCLSVRFLGMTGWPEGLYGLPMAKSGCPADSSIKWKTGTLYQDCEDTDPQTKHSLEFHLNAEVNKIGDVQRSFCMKTSTVNDSWRSQWPSGKYCIYLGGQGCPWGMDFGWVQWDDENTALTSNRNSNWGTLPLGVYNHNT